LLNQLVNWLPILALAWGVLAFGAVYSWAYRPLILLAMTTGLVELWRGRDRLAASSLRPLAVALGLLILAIAAQLIPLPPALIAAVSPATSDFLTQYDLAYAAGKPLHPLSIDPAATWVGLAFAGALSVYLLGMIVRVERTGTGGLWRAVMALGGFIAIIAIVMRGTGTKFVYGFWRPQFDVTPFGPFVNRNHFAGWMLMALPFVMGGLWARLHRHRIKAGWRNRLVWLGSPAASELVVAAAVTITMALSLILSVSRSGTVVLATTILLLFGVAWRGASRETRRWLVVYTLVFAMIAFGWGRTDELSARFASMQHDFRGRADIWRDAASVIKQFPIVGTGLNTFGTAMILYQRADLTFRNVHAHSDFLQLIAEGGLLLVIPAALCAVLLAKRIYAVLRSSPADGTRIGAVIGILAILFQEIGDFSLQMPGNAILFCTLCAIAAAQPRNARVTVEAREAS